MKRAEKVRFYYKAGLWSKSRVLDAVKKGWISETVCQSILSGAPEEEEGGKA